MTQSIHVLTSVAHSKQLDKDEAEGVRKDQEKAAVAAIQSATAMSWQTLQESHATVWQSL